MQYQCLLSNVVHRDDDLIAHVTSELTKAIAVRDKVRHALMHQGLKLAHEKNLTLEEITPGDTGTVL